MPASSAVAAWPSEPGDCQGAVSKAGGCAAHGTDKCGNRGIYTLEGSTGERYRACQAWMDAHPEVPLLDREPGNS